ncbi:unnamed protein product [Allacma fusca]|uniref:Ionotropic receptor n=1 Tax=Allacma fusca TaxID=39272 RepID=A0A8J2KUG2_9HEXA|nr:unnamed protein product [Allacma fusca]
MNLHVQIFGLIAFWHLVPSKAFLEGKLVNQIASDVKNCILTLAQITIPIDYNDITTPFILRVYPDNSSNLVTVSPSIFKERTLRCYAAFVFFESPEALLKSKCSASRSSQEYRSCEMKKARDIHRVITSLTPNKALSDLILIFHQYTVPRNLLSNFQEYLYEFLYGSPVFILHLKNMGRANSLNKHHRRDRFQKGKLYLSNTSHETFAGYYYGGHGTVQGSFNCQASECYKMMISEFERVTNHGKKIIWFMSALPREEQIQSLQIGSPLQRNKPRNLYQTIYGFLVQELDSNFTESYFGISEPHIFFDVANSRSNYYQEVPLSYTTSKMFITSDSIVAITLDYKIYTTPFELIVWICIAIGGLLVALILSADIFPSGQTSLLEKFILSFLSLVGSLADQGWDESPKDVSKISGIKKSKSRSIILIAWLISSIVLSNGYKGFMKTAVITGREFRTKWKRLEELKNFTLFFPTGWMHDVGLVNRKAKNVLCQEVNRACLRRCSSDIDENRFKCDLNNEFIRFNSNTSKTIVAGQFKFFCDEDLEKIIETSLTSPRTALVLFSKEFDYYWSRVGLKMQGTKLKFAHNRNAGNDPFLRSPVSIYIANRFKEKYHYVAKRVQIMLSSGFYSLWEKWDRIRFPECHSNFRGNANSHGTDVRALSMESSLVLALYAFLWSLLLSLVIFIAEILYCFFPR